MTNNKMCLVFAGLLGLAGAGCSKGGGGGDARCGEVTAGAVDRMMGNAANNPMMPDEAKAQLKDRGDKRKAGIVKRCTEDKWASDVLDCYAKASTMPEIRTCRGKLPADQGQKLQAEEMAVMMAGGGMMGAHASLEQLQRRMAGLDQQIEQTQQELTNAKDDAARTAAKEKLVQLQRQQFMIRSQIGSMSGSAAAAGSGAAAPAGSAAAGSGGSATP